MSVLTDQDLIRILRSGQKTITLEKDTIITPSAKERLRSEGIEISFASDRFEPKTGAKPWDNIKQVSSGKTKEQLEFVDFETGEKFSGKPEHFTAIRGNKLVVKNHPRIIFRGKLDSFIAELLIFMLDCQNQHLTGLLEDLKTIKNFAYDLQTAEVGERELKAYLLLGLSIDELREHSHYPKKYYETEHLFQMGHDQQREVLVANHMRALSRELELVAFSAFFDGKTLHRPEIIQALNRLSSAFYIIELKIKSGYYLGEKTGDSHAD